MLIARELRWLHLPAAVAHVARMSALHSAGPSARSRRVQLGQTRDPLHCAQVRSLE